jgi:predicted Zn-dependent protease
MLGLTDERMEVNRDAFLRAIDGLVFGNNPREGFVEGAHFYHPELEFQIDFPAGLEPSRTHGGCVCAGTSARRAAATNEANVHAAQQPAGYTCGRWQPRGMRPQNAQDVRIHGYNAVLATYRLRDSRAPAGGSGGFHRISEIKSSRS